MQQSTKFYKMHGLGNDFVVIDTINQPFDYQTFNAPLMSDRHLGIGFDQLLLIGPATDADFSCRIFNADGSEAEQCGNGLRCVARFIHEEKLSAKKTFSIATLAGIAHITIHDYQHIVVSMGIPQFASPDIPLLPDHPGRFHIDVLADQPPLELTLVSMGNPHAILTVPQVKAYPVTEIGKKIAGHPLFPHGTNVGFMEIIDRQHVRLRTFERGVGETCACGTNACAAVVAGILNQTLDTKVTVELRYGNLIIEWQGHHQPVQMTGPAETIFTGCIN